MDQATFNKKKAKGEVEMITEKEIPPEIVQLIQEKSSEETKTTLADYASIIEALRKVKPFRTTAPTNVPKSFLDAIEFYDSGGVRRVYFYVNKVWRYVTLT